MIAINETLFIKSLMIALAVLKANNRPVQVNRSLVDVLHHSSLLLLHLVQPSQVQGAASRVRKTIVKLPKLPKMPRPQPIHMLLQKLPMQLILEVQLSRPQKFKRRPEVDAPEQNHLHHLPHPRVISTNTADTVLNSSNVL